MAESEIKLEQGMVTYISSDVDYKQQFFIDSFSNMKALLEGVKNLAMFSKELYENSSATLKSKIENVPDFDDIVKGAEELLEKHEACCKCIEKKEKVVSEAMVMTAEELAAYEQKQLEEIEKAEKAALISE